MNTFIKVEKKAIYFLYTMKSEHKNKNLSFCTL